MKCLSGIKTWNAFFEEVIKENQLTNLRNYVINQVDFARNTEVDNDAHLEDVRLMLDQVDFARNTGVKNYAHMKDVRLIRI